MRDEFLQVRGGGEEKIALTPCGVPVFLTFVLFILLNIEFGTVAQRFNNPESNHIMQLLIIGPGCSKCKTLAQFTEQAVKELGITAEINKVTDLKQIMALGVMMTPALAVNGTIKVVGKVPTIPEIKAILQQAAA